MTTGTARSTFRYAISATLLALACAGAPTHAAQAIPVGVKVYLQAWSPLAPANDVPAIAFASRDGISSSMNAAWDAGRSFLADPRQSGSLRQRLEQPNLVARGVTLRFLDFNLNPLGPIDLQPAGPGAFRIHWRIPDSYFDFKSTTPSAGGVGIARDADPEFSFRFDLDITLGAMISDAPGGALLTVTDVSVVPSHLNFDSHNLSGDAVKAVADAVSTFMKGEGLNSLLNDVIGDKNVADVKVNGHFDLKKLANARLQPLNEQIASSGALKYARLGLWTRVGPSGQALGLLFGVKALPLPAGSLAINGNLQFMAGSGKAALSPPASCNGLFGKGDVEVEVQRGPRPVLDADPLTDAFQYGVAPTSVIPNAVFSGAAVTGGQCAYQLTGLSVWPNRISFPPPTVNGNGNDAASTAYWDVRPKSGVSPLITCAAPTRDGSTRSADGLRSMQTTPVARAFVGAAGNAACAGNYDLVARSAVAVNAGHLGSRVKYVRPGDAVENGSTVQNAETSGAASSQRARNAQTSVWGQPATGAQAPTSTAQRSGASRTAPASQAAKQAPTWTPPPSPLGKP